ncbi:MAG: CaiB/BaiF CoA transferase family protein [Burkholderiaceae bacterium]
MTNTDQHPLSALKVIELHAIGPVPFAGMILRQLGASIIRVSPPQDPGLGVGIKPEFDLLNAGKTPLELDLKSEAGLAALHEQLSQADVLLEGFRPGVLERLGLDPAELRNKHPRLVIGRLSGWGEQGELSARAGHDINYLAMAGLLYAIGSREDPAVPLNVVGDFGGGAMHLLLGILAKLIQRSTTNLGGVATTSILAGSIGLTPMFYGMMAGERWNRTRANNLLDGATPFYRVYRTADQRHVAVGALEPKFFKELIGLVGLGDQVNLSRQYDPETWPELARLLAEKFASRPMQAWADDAALVDCCVSPVLDFLEAADHPHNLANGWYANEPFPQTRPTIDFS